MRLGDLLSALLLNSRTLAIEERTTNDFDDFLYGSGVRTGPDGLWCFACPIRRPDRNVADRRRLQNRTM